MAFLRCLWSRGLSTRRTISALNEGYTRRLLRVSASTLGTEEDLENAKERVMQLTQDPGNNAKLTLYGLYKQVHVIRYCSLAIQRQIVTDGTLPFRIQWYKVVMFACGLLSHTEKTMEGNMLYFHRGGYRS